MTVCTRGLRRWFGDVIDGKMRLSEAGRIVAKELRNTEKIRPDIFLDQWVVMPDRLHAVIVLRNELDPCGAPSVASSRLKSGSLGAVVGQLKSVCTKRIRGTGLRDFAWQTRYHDHVIRDETALSNIRTYINQNPAKWTPNKNARLDNTPDM